MMAQWNPLHDLMSLQERMNQLFEDASQRRASGREPQRDSPHGVQDVEAEFTQVTDAHPADEPEICGQSIG